MWWVDCILSFLFLVLQHNTKYNDKGFQKDSLNFGWEATFGNCTEARFMWRWSLQGSLGLQLGGFGDAGCELFLPFEVFLSIHNFRLKSPRTLKLLLFQNNQKWGFLWVAAVFGTSKAALSVAWLGGFDPWADGGGLGHLLRWSPSAQACQVGGGGGCSGRTFKGLDQRSKGAPKWWPYDTSMWIL